MAKGRTSATVKAAKGPAALKSGLRIEPGGRAAGYFHKDKSLKGRPEVGAAPRFRAKHPPASYRYDSSLSPALEWDSNPAREVASFLMACIEQAAALPAPHLFEQRRVLGGADGAPLLEVAGLQDALAGLKKLQRPFLNWAGKARIRDAEPAAFRA